MESGTPIKSVKITLNIFAVYYYYDRKSVGISLKSPLSATTPRILTLDQKVTWEIFCKGNNGSILRACIIRITLCCMKPPPDTFSFHSSFQVVFKVTCIPKLYISSATNRRGRIQKKVFLGRGAAVCMGRAVWPCKLQGVVAQEIYLLSLAYCL